MLEFFATNTVGGCQQLQPIVLYCADGSDSESATAGQPCTTNPAQVSPSLPLCNCGNPPSTTPFFTDEHTIEI